MAEKHAKSSAIDSILKQSEAGQLDMPL